MPRTITSASPFRAIDFSRFSNAVVLVATVTPSSFPYRGLGIIAEVDYLSVTGVGEPADHRFRVGFPLKFFYLLTSITNYK